MQIQLNTDSNVDGGQDLVTAVEAEVVATLAHWGERLTRVEVHLADESAGRSTGADKRCVLEARPAGHQPVSATHHADTVNEALSGALDKLTRVLDTAFGREDDRKGKSSIRHEP